MEIKWKNNEIKNFTWKHFLNKEKTMGQEEQLISL